MKNILKPLKPLALLALILLAAMACDKDYSNIESDIVGVDNFTATSKVFPVISYTKKISEGTNGVQTNSLGNHFLGVYKDPNAEFGTTTASVVTQVIPQTFSPDFGENPVIESVILTIPYFSELIDTDDDGNNSYTLDSIYGNPTAPFKLTVYRNNYLLSALDPDSNLETAQAYYSSQSDVFFSQATELIYQQDEFVPSSAEIVETTGEEGDETTTRTVPSLRLDIKTVEDNGDYWKQLIIDNQDNSVLSNSDNFTNFFRGLVFKVEQIGDDGNMILLNLASSASNITIKYTNDDSEADEFSTYILNLSSGIKVNLLETTDSAISTGNEVDGDENLYLKGGNGSMSVIDLFNGDIENEEGVLVNAETYFTDKKDKWIINEANLIFHVNQDLLQGDEPERVLLYDLKNNVPIIDYFLDGTTNTTTPNNSKILHSEILERDSDENGIRYKFRITEHLNNILLRDSTNVKLGLYVASNVNLISSSKIEGTIQDEEDESNLFLAPITNILAPKGTILYGSKPEIEEGKRVEFEIYFTEPEN
jgi:hypothetical protein